MSITNLSFSLRLADTERELQGLCEVRAESYGRHMPGVREAFLSADQIDRSPDTAVLICEDKQTGRIVGTSRIQTSLRAPLLIEGCIEVPPHMATFGRAEITRLAAVPGADPMVKLALWKAAYLYCQAAQARFMVIGARSEALVRQYKRLGFDDVYSDRRMVPLDYAGGALHRVLAFDVVTAERTWRQSSNPLYSFIFDNVHPDINFQKPAAYAKASTSRKVVQEAVT
jgi:hypothetical protein